MNKTISYTKISLVIVISCLLIAMLSGNAKSQGETKTVYLEWDANTEPDMDHYIVYYGTESGNYTNQSDNISHPTTMYYVDIPNDGQVYYFAVKAVDSSGLESEYSDEANTEDYEGPPDYLYLPPVKPIGLGILGMLQGLPFGTTVEIESDKIILTYPNGLIIEIDGATVTIIQGGEED